VNSFVENFAANEQLNFPDHSSENVSETSVSLLGHSTFFKHIITYFAEDLKLFFSCECVNTITGFHNLENVCFGSDHFRT
jgi:hypothetical protein